MHLKKGEWKQLFLVFTELIRNLLYANEFKNFINIEFTHTIVYVVFILFFVTKFYKHDQSPLIHYNMEFSP